MRKLAFALAAAVIVGVGCSGGGTGGTTTTGTTGGNPNDSTAFATIPNSPGAVTSVYLSGQGRAAGDEIAIMHSITLRDASGGRVDKPLSPNVRVQLNGYTHNQSVVNVASTVSRLFDKYQLDIQELDVDTGNGFVAHTGPNQPLVSVIVPAYFRVFPGRQTSVAVRLDDSMFDSQNNYAFDLNQFEIANFSQPNPADPLRMNGFLSDYLMFDISGLAPADLPPFPDASGNATAFFMNGDNFALGTLPIGPPDQSTADPLPFFTLTPIGYVSGKHVGPRTAINPVTGQSTPIPGTYVLDQVDPRNPLNPAAKITALIGIYKNYTKVINSVGTNPQGFEIFAFPSTLDDGVDDLVMFNISGGVISKLYFGQMDMTAGTIKAWPVSQISTPGDVSNEVDGAITDMDSADVTLVHSGHYTLGATNLPGTFSTSGRFIIYRR